MGLRCIQAGVYGAYYNVLTNLDNMQNKEYAEKVELRKLYNSAIIYPVDTISIHLFIMI